MRRSPFTPSRTSSLHRTTDRSRQFALHTPLRAARSTASAASRESSISRPSPTAASCTGWCNSARCCTHPRPCRRRRAADTGKRTRERKKRPRCSGVIRRRRPHRFVHEISQVEIRDVTSQLLDVPTRRILAESRLASPCDRRRCGQGRQQWRPMGSHHPRLAAQDGGPPEFRLRSFSKGNEGLVAWEA